MLSLLRKWAFLKYKYQYLCSRVLQYFIWAFMECSLWLFVDLFPTFSKRRTSPIFSRTILPSVLELPCRWYGWRTNLGVVVFHVAIPFLLFVCGPFFALLSSVESTKGTAHVGDAGSLASHWTIHTDQCSRQELQNEAHGVWDSLLQRRKGGKRETRERERR